MQVTETLNEGLRRGYRIVLPASELEETVNGKLAEAQPTVEMKGFRKGKVPMALLKKQFGQRLLGEAMQETIDGAMSKHFNDSGDRPAQQPDVKMTNEDWKEGDDVEVEMSYEALPTIPDVDFKAIDLEKLVAKADEAAVDEALANLAENAQDFKDRKKTAKAKDGDQIVFDFLGKVDGEAFDGGASEDYPLVLGSNSFIPGFEEGLVGVKSGETRDVTVHFPEDYQATHLAGKPAVFEVTVKELREKGEVAIDDELAARLGFDDLGALREAVAGQINGQHATALRQALKKNVLDALADGEAFDIPPSLYASEYENVARAMNPNAAEPHNHGQDDDQDHAHPAADEGMDDDAKSEAKAVAERRVRLGLLLTEVGRVNNVEVTEDDTRQAVFEEARRYPGQEQQVLEYFQKNQEAMQQLAGPIFEDKTVDFILEMASVTEVQTDVETLYAAPEETVAPAKKKAAKKSAAKKAAKTADKAEAKTDAKKAAPKKAAAKKAAAKKPAAKKAAKK